MKKYLVGLFLTALVSISLVSCGDFINGYESARQEVWGFKYKFTSDVVRLAVDSGAECCMHEIYKSYSPVYEQHYVGIGVGLPSLQVDALDEGDTLTIYCYKREFTDTKDKSTDDFLNEFEDIYERYFMDSVVIIGATPIYRYKLEHWGDTLSLTEVDNICPYSNN